MVSHYGSNINSKRTNIQLASLACGVALAAVAIVGGSEILRDKGQTETVSPSTPVFPRHIGPAMEEPDFGSVGIDLTLNGLAAQTSAASGLQDARGMGQPGEGTTSAEATLIDPTDFGSLGIESVLAAQSSASPDEGFGGNYLPYVSSTAPGAGTYPPEASLDYSLPTTFAADFFGAGQPGEGVTTTDAPLFGTMVDAVYVIESDIQLP